jgi:transposase
MRSIAVVPMDIHKKFSVATPMTGEGEVVKKIKIAHGDKDQMREFFRQFPEGTDVVMEATFNWPWIADLAKEAGLSPHLAHCGRVREMAKGMGKSDKKDAIFQGRLWLAGGDVFPEVYLAPPQVRDMRAVFRARLLLVKIRVMVKNNIHGQLFRLGILVEDEEEEEVSDLFSQKGRRILNGLELPQRERYLLDNKLGVIDDLSRHIIELEHQIKKDLKYDARAEILESLPGVGEILAHTILGEIGEVERFANSRALAAYAGVLPLENQSADKDFGKKTSKMSNRFLRLAAIEAVTGAIRKSARMKSLHSRVKARNKKKAGKARVAVAREIMELVYLLLTRKEKYKEERPQRPGSKKQRKRNDKLIKEFLSREIHRPLRASPDCLYAGSCSGSQADQ